MTQWFDAHLDLAYLAACGRDMLSPDLATCGGPDLPAAVTLPSLSAGGVTHALATIFIELDGNQPEISYAAGDAAAAARVGRAQLEIYRKWAQDGLVELRFGGQSDLHRLHIGILVEGADCIASPAELSWWVERGVVAVGLAWARGSRYAGGNMCPGGLSDLGREMVGRIDDLGVVHDLSHLSDAAMDELLSLTQRPVMASHSNCRAIIERANCDTKMLPRHLRDETIREIGRRGGMIGLNLYSMFLIPGGGRDRRATLTEAVAHVEHMCELVGHRGAVGLGSDMDGGLSAEKLPEGISRPADLVKLAGALSARGWSREEVEGFAGNNWRRFWQRCGR